MFKNTNFKMNCKNLHKVDVVIKSQSWDCIHKNVQCPDV